MQTGIHLKIGRAGTPLPADYVVCGAHSVRALPFVIGDELKNRHPIVHPLAPECNGILPRSGLEPPRVCRVFPRRSDKIAANSAGYDHWSALALPLLGCDSMTMPLEDIQNRLCSTQTDAHPFCFVCSGSNPQGLALRYTPQPDGSVAATFLGNCALEGYSGLLHGGVIAAMLDGAMTNCLFTHGLRALTVELNVRYRSGVNTSEETRVRAWLEDSRHNLHQLQAELTQGGAVKATATGKFMMSDEQ